MHTKRFVKRIKVTPQSLEEIRRDNRAYFADLAEQIGELAACEAEQRYLEEIARELDTAVEAETTEVVMVQIVENNEQDETPPSCGDEEHV